ncbi:MAG: radical SAM/SPASM domain-containing protein [Thermoguttaceae bacterium]
MLFRLSYRAVREVSWRLLWKAGVLWCAKGFFALKAYKKRLRNNILFPPFLFFGLTNACNLRCRGCWVASPNEATILPFEAMQNAISVAQKQSVYFYTLLGGEPFLASSMWEIMQQHPESYFQVITNGQFLSAENVARLKKLGNVSPLVSIDGLETENDYRRGIGTFAKAIDGCKELQKQHLLYGVATVVTGKNFEEVVTEEYAKKFIDLGAMYLWFYVYRPVGADPATELTVSPKQLLELRRRLIKLRRKMPIIIIDTYWDANGHAVCPASKGMAFQIGPKGSIEPCPPLSVARNFLSDNDGNIFKTINESDFLRRFQDFVRLHYYGDKSQGCVLLDFPQELAAFFRSEHVTDMSGRDFLTELEKAEPKPSHFMPGDEIPEDYWVYRLLKKNLFFGMSAYG